MCDPNSSDCRCKRLQNQIMATLDNISSLIAQAIKDPSVRHKNDNLMKCWEIKDCRKSECPAYENDNLRCWQVEGTYCGEKVQGTFAQKYENCMQCKVFKAACAAGNEAITEQVNNLVHLLYEKEKEGEQVNKELLQTLGTLNKKEQVINELSATDNLTGLYSKKYLLEHLTTEVERFKRYKHPLSLLVIDIDGFKDYNDTFGHLEGDLLLKKFGGVIKQSIRKIDFACRLEGDEFVVVLPETEQKTALLAAKRILQTLGKQAFHPQEDTTIVRKSVSIGLASITGTEANAQEVIQRAETAMNQARKDGGDRIALFNPPLKTATSAA